MQHFRKIKKRKYFAGDSGGGFYVKDSSGRWIVYGLVSEGLIVSGSCDASKYVVYVDVAKFLRWIIESEFFV